MSGGEVLTVDKPFTHHSFQQFLNEHKLMGARCRDTGEVFVPPRPLCPGVFSDDMEWVELSGEGTLAAYTAVHIGSTAMIDAGYDRLKPYCSGIVQLKEGPAISAQIIDVDAKNPENIQIGTPLQVTFLDRKQGEQQRTVLAFAPLT